eukprot:6425919-Amphidinium_carterae.1
MPDLGTRGANAGHHAMGVKRNTLAQWFSGRTLAHAVQGRNHTMRVKRNLLTRCLSMKPGKG